MADDREPSGFLSRWSRRKVQAREGLPLAEPPPPSLPTAPPAADAAIPAPVPAEAPAAPPAPTLDEALALTPEADFSRFVARDTAPEVRNAALKQLFTDPHYNVMDGLDIYIDDYGRPDPLPDGMLRQMVQSAALGLFSDSPEADAAPATTTTSSEDGPPSRHEDPDLRLQPDDVTGRAAAGEGPGGDAGRQC